MNAHSVPRPTRTILIENVFTFLAIVAASWYGLTVARVEATTVATVWPASAVAFTAIALRGWRLFPPIALGTMTAAFADHQRVLLALLAGVPPAVEMAVATVLLRRTQLDLQFRGTGDAVRLALIATFASIGGAAAGVAINSALASPPKATLAEAFLSRALGDAIGILAFAPALLLWLGRRAPRTRPGRTELVGMVGLTIAVSVFVLLTYQVGTANRLVAMWLTLFPLLLWTSVRADIRVAAMIVVVLSIAGTTGARLGTGALVSPSGALEALNVQAFHVMMVLMVLVGASSMSAREDALLKSQATERKLALVFEGTRDAQSLYDVDSGTPRVIMANRSWLEGVKAFREGIGDEDLIGRTSEEIRALLGLEYASVAVHIERMRETIAGGQVITYEVESPSPFGPRIVVTTLVPMREGGGTRYVLSTVRDVTQARTSERRLRESEVRFAAVSDATHELQILFGVDSSDSLRVLHLNRAARELLEQFWPGVGLGDVIGQPAATIIRTLPGFTREQYERNMAFAREAIATRQVRRFEDQIHTPQGRRVGEVTIIPIANEAGVVTHLLRSSVDISDRKRAEETARRFNEDLERRVAERTAQLAMTNRELEAFGYSLSHDLRAPLRSVEGFSRALVEDLENGETHEAQDHARRIHAAALRMKGLVDDLLRLSQLSTTDLERTPIDVTAMATEIVRELAAANPDRRVRATVEPGLRAVADAKLVFIALQNLLDNAWKYTSPRVDACIHVGQVDRGGVRTTFVRDNGVGFDPRYAGRLFTPFQRLHKPGEFEGAGIGLATVHRIVAAHGGRVWAESSPDDGATFYLTLEATARTDGPDPGAAP